MRGLGGFQGRFLAGEPLPSFAWLSRDCAVAELTRRPAVAGDAEALARLVRLPATICHFDLWSANLFAGATAACDDATYAIDWSRAGYGPPGYDLANAVFDSIWMCDMEPGGLDALSVEALAAYLAGLRDAGWTGDAAEIARTYVTVAELKFARMRDRLAAVAADPERREAWSAMYRLPVAEVLARRRATLDAAATLASRLGVSR